MASAPKQATRTTALLEARGLSRLTAVVLAAAAVTGYFQVLHPGLVSLAVLVVLTVEFIRRMDQGIPLMQITALIATLQWLIGPSLSYYFGLEHGRHFMYVRDDFYFQFALPATSVYVLGILLFGGVIDQKRLNRTVDRRDFFRVGVTLFGISLIAQTVAPSMPGGLAFLFHLCSQLRYVGALYFLLSDHRYRYFFAVGSVLPLFFASAESGMFHDLILWLMMLSTYWVAERSWGLGKKLTFVAVGCICVFTIQVVKQDYRQKLKAGKNPSLVGEMVGAITEERFLEDDVLSLATARLNQGWIISAVMRNVPRHEPFADGETIRTAFLVALVPRILWEDKKGAGGQENFMRFTGLPIERGTSMGISPLGEAYANFGVEGGILFMAIFGVGFSLLYRFVVRHVVKHPDLVFWIPLMFYQGIKAETEMIVVVNQLVKGTLVVFVGYYGLKQILLPFLFKRRKSQGARRTAQLRPRLAGRQ